MDGIRRRLAAMRIPSSDRRPGAARAAQGKTKSGLTSQPRLVIAIRFLIQPERAIFYPGARNQRDKFLLWLGDRRRRLSRAHRFGFLDIEHAQCLSQAALPGLGHFPRRFLPDPLR